MDLIKKKMNEYIMYLIEKEKLTPEEYAVLALEYDRRVHQSEIESNDTIMRIFRSLN